MTTWRFLEAQDSLKIKLLSAASKGVSVVEQAEPTADTEAKIIPHADARLYEATSDLDCDPDITEPTEIDVLAACGCTISYNVLAGGMLLDDGVLTNCDTNACMFSWDDAAVCAYSYLIEATDAGVLLSGDLP